MKRSTFVKDAASVALIPVAFKQGTYEPDTAPAVSGEVVINRCDRQTLCFRNGLLVSPMPKKGKGGR